MHLNFEITCNPLMCTMNNPSLLYQTRWRNGGETRLKTIFNRSAKIITKGEFAKISVLFPLHGINQTAHRKMVLMRFSLNCGLGERWVWIFQESIV